MREDIGIVGDEGFTINNFVDEDYDPEDMVLNYLLQELQGITLGNRKLRKIFISLV